MEEKVCYERLMERIARDFSNNKEILLAVSESKEWERAKVSKQMLYDTAMCLAIIADRFAKDNDVKHAENIIENIARTINVVIDDAEQREKCVCE